MTGGSGDLARFLPGALVDWATAETCRSWGSVAERGFGALLVTDISGFTRLTAKLSRDDGKAGAERIRQVLNGFLARLAAIVEAEGGSILSFEGDALTAGWRFGPENGSAALAAWRSCWCAWRLQTAVSGSDILGETLTLRSAVSVGEVEVLHLRLGEGSRKVILLGPCIDDVSRCAALAESGELLVSDAAWSLVRERARGSRGEDAVALRQVDEPPPYAAVEAVGKSCEPGDVVAYLPPILRGRMGLPLADWLGELRSVTTLFVRLIGTRPLRELEPVEAAMDLLETKAAALQGCVLRAAACEGGLQALLVFGLPGQAHRDDPRRGCLAALDLREAGERLGLSVSTGIASGEVFCGAIGTSRRAEYTVLGEAVNRAARLSVLAAGRILTDEATAALARSAIDFDGPWTMQVAGIRTPLATYVATGRRAPDRASGREPLVNRHGEMRRLEALLDRPQVRGSMTLIEGEPGIGKSKLLDTFVESCRARGLVVLEGAADDLERTTPYFALRGMLRAAVQLDGRRGRDAHARIAALLGGQQDRIRFIPLLNDVLELDLDETGIGTALSSDVRAENLRRLLGAILTEALGPGASVLVLEDVQWLDPQSDALLVELLAATPGLVMVATARPGRTRALAIESAADVDRWSLEALGPEECAELVRSHVHDDAVASRVQRAIWERSSGNPFFVGEICRVLRDRPEVGARAERRPGSDDGALTLPISAQAAVLSRIDLLPQAEHFLLKIASAIGASFTAADLESIDLVAAIGIDVREALANLLDAHLVRTAGPERFVFSHAIVREVIYSGMLSEQRRAAHAAVAEAMERAGQPNDAESLPIVLTQWQRAENKQRSFEYLDRVAELRLRQFENEAAVTLTRAFLDIAGELDIAVAPDRLASAYFVLGAAELSLGRNAEAEAAYASGLRLLGMPLPTSRGECRLAVLGQIAEHLALSGRRSRRRDSPGEARARDPIGDEVLLRAAQAHEDLTRIFYFQGDKMRLLYATLRATNLAERATRLSPVLVVNYASLGAICGVVPLRRRASRYLELAARLAETVESPAVGIRVAQMSGLYETSVGDWHAAGSHFEAGLASALELGDRKRWMELAVAFETIINPALLNPAYRGETAWRDLVEQVIRLGRDTGDLHILGCGLTGALRGHRALGQGAAARDYGSELQALLETEAEALEPISRLEGAALLAVEARENGQESTSARWLGEASRWVEEVNPAIKSRTMMAFVALFRAAGAGPDPAAAGEVGATRQRLASRSVRDLARFSRIYPIGRPRTALFAGDLKARRHRRHAARRLWRQALQQALRVDMPADALAALARLARDGGGLADADRVAREQIDRRMRDAGERWVEAARSSAELLAVTS